MKLKYALNGSEQAKKARGYIEGRRARATEAHDKARADGLLNVGKEHAFYKSIGIGEERLTSFLPGKKGGESGKLRAQWWAPANVVRFDRILMKMGFSSKLRAKALRCLAAGEAVPARFEDALARYTEEVFSRR